jgi:hypothetical protein
MPSRRRKKSPEVVVVPPPIIEQAADPPLTLDRMASIAKLNGHTVFREGNLGFLASVVYPIGCSRCGAYAAWDGDVEYTSLHGVFLGVYNRPCSVRRD